MSLPPRAPPLVAYWPTGAEAALPDLATFSALRWSEHAGNPLIRAPLPSPLIADPTFLPPSQTPDGQWHLFAHSLLGLHHYSSGDGLRWTLLPQVVARRALRPHLLVDRGRYHLAYEKVRLPVPWGTWTSHIEIRSSSDLYTWSDPRTLLRPCLPWHRRDSSEAVGNPCLVKVGERWRLYYSAGLVRLEDCGFDEPAHIGVAESASLDGPFVPLQQPLLSPSDADPFANLGAGAIKVLPLADGFAGFQNGIYRDNQGRSRSAIRLLGSTDGLAWTPRSDGPILAPDRGWKSSHVYACDVRWVEGKALLYFNARDGWHWTRGREAIGLAVGA